MSDFVAWVLEQVVPAVRLRRRPSPLSTTLAALLDGTRGFLVLVDEQGVEVSEREPIRFRALDDMVIADFSSVDLVPFRTGQIRWSVLDSAGNRLTLSDGFVLITSVEERVTVRTGPWNEILRFVP